VPAFELRHHVGERRARPQQRDQRLGGLNTELLSPRVFYDFRILRAAIHRELFKFEDRQVYTQNPMTYAGALNVNIYIKRAFAPLGQRVGSISAILDQAPTLMAAAKANLAGELPRPFVETAIEVAQGAVDFLGKDLVEALKDFNEQPLRTRFLAAQSQL